MAMYVNRMITGFLALMASIACMALCFAPSLPAYLMPALWPFVHSGFLHAALNVLALLSACFLCRLAPVWLVLGYLASVMAPDCVLHCASGLPTVGLSGVVYFLLGVIGCRAARRLRFLCWMLFSFALGFALPMVNGALHFYCCALGCALACIVQPFSVRKHESRPRSANNR